MQGCVMLAPEWIVILHFSFLISHFSFCIIKFPLLRHGYLGAEKE